MRRPPDNYGPPHNICPKVDEPRPRPAVSRSLGQTKHRLLTALRRDGLFVHVKGQGVCSKKQIIKKLESDWSKDESARLAWWIRVFSSKYSDAVRRVNRSGIVIVSVSPGFMNTLWKHQTNERRGRVKIFKKTSRAHWFAVAQPKKHLDMPE